MNHSDVKLQITNFTKNRKQHTNDSSDETTQLKSTSVELFQSQVLSSLAGDVVSGLHESVH